MLRLALNHKNVEASFICIFLTKIAIDTHMFLIMKWKYATLRCNYMKFCLSVNTRVKKKSGFYSYSFEFKPLNCIFDRTNGMNITSNESLEHGRIASSTSL